MLEPILAVLRRRLAGAASERQERPNTLRREVVRAERLRREAMPAEVPPRASRATPEETRSRGGRVPATPDAQAAARRPLSRMLTSRSGLRQAWMLKEILSPPVGFRGPYEHS